LVACELKGLAKVLGACHRATVDSASECANILFVLCSGCSAALHELVACRVIVLGTGASKQPQEKQLTGLDILSRLVWDVQGTDVSRAFFAAILGELATLPVDDNGVNAEVAAAPSPDESSGAATEIKAVHGNRAGHVLRGELFKRGMVGPMLEAFWGITTLLVDSTTCEEEKGKDISGAHHPSRPSRKTEARSGSSRIDMQVPCLRLHDVKTAFKLTCLGHLNSIWSPWSSQLNGGLPDP
jgi:hypothetical protein